MTLSRPLEFFIQWHLTERCNLACRHCYQSGPLPEEMSLAEIVAALGEIGETLAAWEEAYGLRFSPSFNVTGGEPLLREDLFAILGRFGAAGFALYLLSNGTLIDADTAGALKKSGVRGVQISLEGPEPIHEEIRGPGSFAAALRGVGHLAAAGIPVTLNVTLSRLNADHLESMLDLAEAHGAARLGFSRLVPAGRGLGMTELMLSSEEVARVYRRLLHLPRRRVEVVTGDPMAWQFGPAPLSAGGHTPAGGCAAGVSGLTLLADGTMLPCRRLEIPIGNIRRDSLREVWAGSEVLNALRDRSRDSGHCGSCDHWADCRGCRAIAPAGSQAGGRSDFLAPDPQCPRSAATTIDAS